MIFVFLIVLIMALIIGNLLISVVRPRRKAERGFANPSTDYAEVPEVIEHMQNLHENTALIQGSLQATNRKIDLLNNRVIALEKVVTELVQEKIED